MSNITFEELRQYSKQLFEQERATMNGADGEPGISAYDVAVRNGFSGTEQEWLDSLKGKSAYEAALEAGFVGTEQEFNNLLTAPPKGAYDLAVENGFTGTEQEWLDSLNGRSAYQAAVDNGFTGTEQEWLDQLAASGGDVAGDIKQSTNSNTNTDGFLACDGQKFLQSAYPDLFSKIGLIRDGYKANSVINGTPTFTSGSARGCDITSDGRYIFFGTGIAGESLIKVDTNDWTYVNVDATLPSLLTSVAISPDQTYLIASSNASPYLFKYDVATLAKDESFTSPVTATPFSMDFKPDGTELAIAMGTQNSVLIAETTNFTISYDLSSEFDGAAYAAKYSPDGTYLASCGGLTSWYDGPVIFETSTYTYTFRIDKTFSSSNCFAIDITSDSRYIAFACAEVAGSTLVIMDTQDNNSYFSVDAFSNTIHSLDFSPSDKELAVGESTNGVAFIDTVKWQKVENRPSITVPTTWIVKYSPLDNYINIGVSAQDRFYAYSAYTYDPNTEFVTPKEETKIYNSESVKAYIKKDQ